MRGVGKRREVFAQQIRRREKDRIKSEIRAKYLSDDCGTDRQSEPVTSPIQYLPLQENSSENNEFSEEMIRLIISYLEKEGNCGTFSNLSVAISALLKEITSIKSSEEIHHLTQCYRSAKSIVAKHVDLCLSEKKDHLSGQSLGQLRRTSFALNLIAIKIKLKCRFFPQCNFKINRDFQQWKANTLRNLQEFVYAEDELVIIDNQIVCTLKEIYFIFLDSIEEQNLQSAKDLLQSIFDNEMIRLLMLTLRNPRLDDTCRIAIIYICFEVANNGMKSIYQHIIDNDFLDYIRFTIAFQEGYKSKHKTTLEQQNETVVVRKMLDFMVMGSQIDSSKLFWEKGICAQLKAVEREGMTDTEMRFFIISTLFVCITNFTDENTLEMIQSSEIFEWVLTVINELIDTLGSNPEIAQLISSGVNVIHFFLQVGECHMNGATVNPYKIKLQYTCGQSILSRCEQGALLLQSYGFETEEQALNSC